MGSADSQMFDPIEQDDSRRILELVAIVVGLLATMFCWQLCAVTTTDAPAPIQEPLQRSIEGETETFHDNDEAREDADRHAENATNQVLV
tara:strand:- start:5945 stop:6214 length:270 start_codon:yes stop_codon:yes gene_type:complete